MVSAVLSLQAAEPDFKRTEVLSRILAAQEISPAAAIGVDDNGIPMLCGTEGLSQDQALTSAQKPPPNPPPPTVIPLGMRSWECVPGVIRRDGVETFRVEVDANSVVSQVLLTMNSSMVEFVVGPNSQNLRDDGLNGDRLAGDRIYTSEQIHYNGSFVPATFLGHLQSPAGLFFTEVGKIRLVETNGMTNEFLVTPKVGLLSTNIAMVESVQLSSNVLITPHLINIKGTNRQTQRSLRASPSPIRNVTLPIYAVFPDAFDLFIFFSMDHIEFVPYDGYAANFYAGAHSAVQVNYTGTGQGLLAQMAYYGSASRLLGLNFLDTASRGVYAANCIHEILHQWSSFTSVSLGLSRGDSHYKTTCSANSMVGGIPWEAQPNGTFLLNCFDDPSKGQYASPLDKYMMGLIPGSAVASLYAPTNGERCSDFASNYLTVTIESIQAVHGVRTPTPENARKNFSLGFVAESYGRWLAPTELTFYDILAGHFTKPIPPEEEAPRINAWVSIDRYFGEGSTWSSDVLGLIRPAIHRIEPHPNGGAQISGAGYPGRNYRLLRSTNLIGNWVVVTNGMAATNGAFMLRDSQTTLPAPRFYRVSTP